MAIYYIYIFLVSVIATAAMTLFSYLVGMKRNKKFHEPELLNSLINGASSIKITVSEKNILGWLAHIGIGLIFTGVLLVLNKSKFIQFDILTVLLLGIVAGVFGIIGWAIMFKTNENPPEVHLKEFYLQLIVAHIIFLFFIMAGFNWLEINILAEVIEDKLN